MLYPQAAERDPFSPTIDSQLTEAYQRWFEVIPANTPALREKAYRLRYQVYCQEHQYEIPEAHPHQMETDAYDCRSVHSLVVNRANGMATGTVRLILSDESDPEATFPIQQLCSLSVPAYLAQSSTAEISRFAISKKIRNMMDGNCPTDIKCSIVLGLMKAVVQMSLELGVTDWLAVMEPALLRLFHRFGICFTPVGPLVEYHGLRRPCHANLGKLLESVRKEHFSLWEFVTKPCGAWSKDTMA